MHERGDAVAPGGHDPPLCARQSARADLRLHRRGAERPGELPEPPTAIFAANDTSAIAVIAVAQELGLRVPEDLSVVGFDNVSESALCSPPLTTVEQRIHEMGARAMEMLVRLIRGDAVERIHVTLDTRLVVRATTAGPRP